MPGKRKSNLSTNSKKARMMKVARIQESSAQAEIRRLEQAETQEESQVRIYRGSVFVIRSFLIRFFIIVILRFVYFNNALY